MDREEVVFICSFFLLRLRYGPQAVLYLFHGFKFLLLVVVRRLDANGLLDATRVFFGLFPMFHGKSKVGFVLLFSGGIACSEGRVKKGERRFIWSKSCGADKHPSYNAQTNTKITPASLLSRESVLIFSTASRLPAP